MADAPTSPGQGTSGHDGPELHVALVGYGKGGEVFHAPLIDTVPGLRLSAVVTGSPERARAAKDRYPGITVYPTAADLWADAGHPGRAYTTVGKWTSHGRDLAYQGETFHWSKRTEWLRYLDLPERTAAAFEVAMNVDSVAGDPALLAAHGWQTVDPLSVSTDPWRYRDYVRDSRGEFTVAKDMNIRLRSGWFSDRSACYLASGRPVVATRVGGLPDLIEDHRTGRLVSPKNTEALATAVLDLLRSPETMRDLGQNAAKEVRSRFSVKRLVRDMDHLYRQLLEEKAICFPATERMEVRG